MTLMTTFSCRASSLFGAFYCVFYLPDDKVISNVDSVSDVSKSGITISVSISPK